MKEKQNQNLILENNIKILSPHILIVCIFSVAISIVTLFFVKDSPTAGFVSERVLIITGILLYTPLFSAEYAENLHEVIISKTTKYRNIIYTRYICVSVVLIAITLMFVLININKITYIHITLMNTVCISLFLGNIGLFFTRMTKKTVLGYMTSLGIYMICMFSEVTYNKSLLFPPVGEVNINLVIIFITALVLCMVSLSKIRNVIT